MNDYLSEDEQLEQIRKWWSENGRYIIAGIGLGVLGLVGWNWHKTTIEREAVEAAALFEVMTDAVDSGNADAAQSALDNLKGDYSGTPYAALAHLAAARLHMENGQPEKAEEDLRGLLDSGASPEVREVARLRLARVLLYLERFDDAVAVLDGGAMGGFRSRFDEARGDIEFARGNAAGARAAWQRALDNPGSPPLVDTELLEMKLADVGPDPATASAADASDEASAAAEPVQ